MNKLGDIIYIDDDVEDCEVFAEVYETIRKELDIPNNLRVFHHAIDYLEYIKLTTDEPALILCDINMPKITGIDLRKVILEDVKQNVTPFILY
ncbi:MAG: response regulator, partial [Campylobacterales bacterium]|nr:response regulator [Campylobacterales bacterium]